MRFIVFQDGDAYVAQGLELDICTHASDYETLHERIIGQLDAELDLAEILERRIPEGPKRFWWLWDSAEELRTCEEYTSRIWRKKRA